MPPREYYEYKQKQQREERANVREQARQPEPSSRPVDNSRDAQQRMAKKSFDAVVKAAEAKAGTYTPKTDKGIAGIIDDVKKSRSVENIRNKERAIQNLLKEAAGPGTPGLVARDSSDNIITDSSGNPIMTGRGSDVFQQGRQEFRDESRRLLQQSPELYRQMYPMAYAAQKGIPALMQFMPGLGMISRVARSALGKAQDAGSGFSEWLRSFGLTPTSSINANIQGEQPSDTGGVIDAAQSVVDQQSPYGAWIGQEAGLPVLDFRDSDNDGIDDRYQAGPGQPYQGPAQGNKIADAWNQSFQVAQPLNTGISSALINTGNPFNIPIGGGPRPDLSGFYQGLGSFV